MAAGFKAITALLLASLILLSLLPGETVASPYKVEGYLKDVQGSPIQNANISIYGQRYDHMSDTYTPTTLYQETDSNGYYSVYIWGWDEPGGFPLGSKLTISYDSGNHVASTEVTIVATLGVWANLTYDPLGSTLARIVISPNPAKVQASKSVILTAQGYDQYGERISFSPTWSDGSGRGTFFDVKAGNPATVAYLAGDDGSYTANITASAGNVKGDVNVSVKKSALSDTILSPVGIAAILIAMSIVLAVVYVVSISAKRDRADSETEEPRPKRVDRRRRQR